MQPKIIGKENKFSSSDFAAARLYEDENVLVIDKPAGVNSDDFEKRVHRLDKDTSGILLIAKNDKSLDFLQEQFKKRKVKKKYLALVVGNLKNKEGVVKEDKSSSSATESRLRDEGGKEREALFDFANARVIETLLGRSPKDRKKQKVYLPFEPGAQGKRKAVTEYKVLQRFEKRRYDLIEVKPKTGRKHQIRVHLSYISHPLAGDKMYGFKNQPCPEGLKRQFLHASYLKIQLPSGEIKEFKSELPEDLKKVIKNL
ncbi:MAG: RluA family pseudouridine synthase [Candidatus Pacebacteria bacterium]|nr:RluA family pseudouridine synthase [Candidatus Paceibacterota bacterium]